MDFRTFLIRRWWLAPLLFAVVGGSVATNLGHGARITLAIASALVLVAVDWWLPAVLVNGLLVGAYFAVGGENSPVFFTIIAAAFLAASSARVRRWLPWVIVSAVVLWAGLLVRGIRYDDVVVNTWQSIGVGALVAAAVAIATATRSRTEARAERVQRTATEERLRMAQDLHDGVGHGLAVIAMQAGVALHVLDSDPAKARASLEAIRATSKESLEGLRAQLATMAGEAPDRPRRGAADLPGLYERVRAAGLRLEVLGEPGAVPEPVGEAVHAVVQEALTNVLRHARATRARVRYELVGATLVVSVTDDGIGGASSGASGDGTGMGLSGMRDRVTGLGGVFHAGPDVEGFWVRAELPTAVEAEA